MTTLSRTEVEVGIVDDILLVLVDGIIVVVLLWLLDAGMLFVCCGA